MPKEVHNTQNNNNENINPIKTNSLKDLIQNTAILNHTVDIEYINYNSNRTLACSSTVNPDRKELRVNITVNKYDVVISFNVLQYHDNNVIKSFTHSSLQEAVLKYNILT